MKSILNNIRAYLNSLSIEAGRRKQKGIEVKRKRPITRNKRKHIKPNTQ